jgi:WD40-like Beta Propeller Repeat
MHRILICLLSVALLVTACGTPAVATSTPVPATDTPPAPTSTALPVSPTIALALPTAARVPPTATDRPTATLLPSLDVSSNGVVVFYSERDGNSEIYAMNADGTGLRRLTNNPAENDSPAISPDG